MVISYYNCNAFCLLKWQMLHWVYYEIWVCFLSWPCFYHAFVLFLRHFASPRNYHLSYTQHFLCLRVCLIQFTSPTPVYFAYFSPYCKTGSQCSPENNTLVQLQLIISVSEGQNIVFLSFQVRFSPVDCFIFITSDVLGVPDSRSQQY